jgi:hypothetical protein
VSGLWAEWLKDSTSLRAIERLSERESKECVKSERERVCEWVDERGNVWAREEECEWKSEGMCERERERVWVSGRARECMSGRVCVSEWVSENTYFLYYFSPHKTADTARDNTVARLQAGTPRNRGSIRNKSKRFLSSPQHREQLWVPQNNLGTRGSIPWGKAADTFNWLISVCVLFNHAVGSYNI